MAKFWFVVPIFEFSVKHTITGNIPINCKLLCVGSYLSCYFSQLLNTINTSGYCLGPLRCIFLYYFDRIIVSDIFDWLFAITTVMIIYDQSNNGINRPEQPNQIIHSFTHWQNCSKFNFINVLMRVVVCKYSQFYS